MGKEVSTEGEGGGECGGGSAEKDAAIEHWPFSTADGRRNHTAARTDGARVERWGGVVPTLSRESGNRKVAWTLPAYPRLFGMLKNPTDARAFVFGRKHTRTAIVEGRARKTRGHCVPRNSGR